MIRTHRPSSPSGYPARVRTGEAIEWIERAQAPDSAQVSGSSVSCILFQAHRYGDAIREPQTGLAVRPENAPDLLGLAFPLIADRRPAEAISAIEKALSTAPGSPAATGVLMRAYAHAERRDDALRLLAGMEERWKTGYVPAAAFVNAYLGLGDNERTFYWLEQAYAEQSNILQFVKTHPYFDPIRNDPRFIDLVRRVVLN